MFMKHSTNGRRGKVFSFGLAAIVLALQALVFQSQGQITLSDGNSVAHLDPGSQAGMYYWAVLNSPDTYQNQLNKQWFWYRVGTTGPEASIDTLTLLTPSQPTANHVTMTYLDTLGRFNLTIDYLLTGGTPTSGTADIAENIRINNTSGAPLNYHFFQYSDFDMGGDGGG